MLLICGTDQSLQAPFMTHAPKCSTALEICSSDEHCSMTGTLQAHVGLISSSQVAFQNQVDAQL